MSQRCRRYVMVDSPRPANDVVPIRVLFYKVIGVVDSEDAEFPGEAVLGEAYLVNERPIRVSLSQFMRLSEADKSVYIQQQLAGCLGEIFDLPEDEQPIYIRKISRQVEVVVTFRYIDPVVRLTLVTLEVQQLKFVPTTKSSIEGLEKLSLLDLRLESATATDHEIHDHTKLLCAICMEAFFDDHVQIITRLPCLHLYHYGCIVRWLNVSHFCPTCRYPMPTVEAGEAGEPSESSNPMPIVEAAGEPSQPQGRGVGLPCSRYPQVVY